MENEKKEDEKVEEKKVEIEKNETAPCCEDEKCSCEDEKCGCEKYKKIVAGIILVILVIGFGYYKLVWRKNNISASEAQAKAESFISNALIQPGTKIEIGEAIKESGMYKMKISVGEGDKKQEVDAYLSVDGKKFIPNLMDVEEIEAQVAEEKKAEAETEKEIPKSEKPVVDLYVMSFCPFGNKAEDTMKPVYDLLKDKVDFNFRYIVSVSGDEIKSLHGEKEVAQNEREACVLKYHGADKWFDYVTYVNKNCGSDGACSDAGLKSAGLVPAKIATCALAEGKTFMKEDAKISADAGAAGSPTMMINSVKTKVAYQYGNSESYKQAICEAFETEPEECSKTLASETATAEGGSCE